MSIDSSNKKWAQKAIDVINMNKDLPGDIYESEFVKSPFLLQSHVDKYIEILKINENSYD